MTARPTNADQLRPLLTGRQGTAGGGARDLFVLRAVVRTALNAIIAMDEDGTIQLWNPAATAMFGWRESEALGAPFSDLIIPARHREDHLRELHRHGETGHAGFAGRAAAISALRADGGEFPVELTLSLAWHEGTRRLFIAFLSDISERASQESDLSAAREQWAAYVDTLVHELRGPLTVIAGYSELLSDSSSPLPPEGMRTALAAIDRKTGEATALVDRLLLAARAESGGLPVSAVRMDLREAAAQAAAKAADRALLAGATILVESANAPTWAWADPKHVSTMLDNLINNALTHAGTAPTIRLRVDPSEPILFVEDDGDPIPMVQRQRLFKRFAQLTHDTPTAGSGLGLYLSRLLAELQGGSLTLDDDEGAGTRFVIRLASGESTAAPVPEAT